MFENETVHDLMELAEDTPYGKACSALWAEAARRAGAEGLDSEEMWCYLRLAAAFTMGGEVTRMVAPFMWVDKRRKERPDLFDARMQDSFAWYYKYVLLVLRDVPQASAAECFNALSEMRTFYQSLGDSLKAYYLREYYVFSMLGRSEDAQEAYRKWQLAEVSEHSDCQACDPQHEVIFHLRRGEWEKAVEVGERALANADDTCTAQPNTLYCHLLVPWLYTGNDDKAWPAHVKVMQSSAHHKPFLEYLPLHLHYLELSANAGRPQRLQRALEMVQRFMPWWVEAETPVVLMDNAVASARVFAAQPDQDQVLELTLPGASLPWVSTQDVVNPTMKQAHDWCVDIALKVAELFDQRPGLVQPHMVDTIKQRLYDWPVVSQLPEEGPIQDVSGQFAPAEIDYRVNGEFSAASTSADGDDEPLLVSIDIHGPWRDYTMQELEAAHEALNTSLPSVYSQRLGQARELDLEAAEETEPARVLLLDAMRHLVDGEYMEAAQCADTAMRTPTEEPISVRLVALNILARAGLLAGYYGESCEASRHRLNVAAACGLPLVQLDSATLLVTGLMRMRQYSEAAEVAYTTLQAVSKDAEFVDQARAEIVMLRSLLVSTLDELDHDTAAAEEALQLVELVTDLGEKFDALGNAMNGFRYDHHFERSFAVMEQMVPVAESWLLEVQAHAAVEPEAQEKAVQAAAKVADAFREMAWARTTQASLVDTEAYEFADGLLVRRLELLQQYRVTEKKTAEFYQADNLEDRGIVALRSRRFSEGFDLLERAAERFIAIGRQYLAVRVIDTIATAKVTQGDLVGARQAAERALSMLDEGDFSAQKYLKDVRETLEVIEQAEADAESD